jgi:uncharacterized protein YabE (DUF348 family)
LSESESALRGAEAQRWPHPLPKVESGLIPAGLITLMLTAAFLGVLFRSYLQSGRVVALQVNGATWQVRTQQQTVGAVLREVGLECHAADIVVPSLDAEIVEDTAIAVQKALPVRILADGQVVEHFTHSARVSDLLLEAGLNAKPHDVVLLNGQPVDLDSTLPSFEWMPIRWPLLQSVAGRLRGTAALPWCRLQLQRAVPLSISDDGTQLSVYSTAATVGEALLSQNIVLYVGDHVRPLLGTLLTAGMHVEIHRASPVAIEADGGTTETRTQARTVAQLLSEVGIELLGKDRVLPGLDTEILSGMTVQVTRVVEAWLIESEDIPFETLWRSDGGLELDQRRTDQPGELGVRKRRVRIVYEDGEETRRFVADEWVERQPVTRILSYGTKIVMREEETPHGAIRYWRKIRMLATSYSPSTAGKPLDHPLFGITRLGWQATKGVVAVDPRLVNLGTKVYVPGYGFGTAADTGGLIKGRRIDLCYDDDNLVLWKSWVDVYLLEPVPAVEDINWVLLDFPTERR